MVARDGKRAWWTERRTRVSPLRDFFGNQDGKVVSVAHLLLLGASLEFDVEPTHGRKMQSTEESVKVDGGSVHTTSRSSRLVT